MIQPRDTRKNRGFYADRFNGSLAMFRSCWRSLLESEQHNGVMSHAETKEFLHARASELVNDPESRFYMYG